MRRLLFAVVVGCSSPTSAPVVDSALEADAPIADAHPGEDDPEGTWRSALFPKSWTPAFTDTEGRFLHDFSYAGYLRSEAPLPTTWPGIVADITSYGAVPDSTSDSAPAFTAAIAAVTRAGGGTVYIPDGEYTLASPLVITASNVRVRGQSRANTKLYFSATNMNSRQSLLFRGAAAPSTGAIALVADAAARSHRVRVASADGFAVGDHVLIDFVITQAFIDEHGMDGVWDASPNSARDLRKVFFRREILAIDGDEIVLDVPLRYPLKLRDMPQLRRDEGALHDCAIEQLSLNNAIAADIAANNPRAHAIGMIRVQDCFIRDVGTYESSRAPVTAHLQSGGIYIVESKRVTVADSSIAHAQNHGDGGAGYGFEASISNEILFRDVRVTDVRHGFIQNWDFGASGLVWLRGDALDNVAVNSGFPMPGRSELHHRLAIANLWDSTRDTAGFAAFNRGGESSNSGHAGTQTVFWNVSGKDEDTRMSIYQVGYGYVIGTRDITARVEPDFTDNLLGYATRTAPTDWLEGAGEGATLWPPSLFEAQLALRTSNGASSLPLP